MNCGSAYLSAVGLQVRRNVSYEQRLGAHTALNMTKAQSNIASVWEDDSGSGVIDPQLRKMFAVGKQTTPLLKQTNPPNQGSRLKNLETVETP